LFDKRLSRIQKFCFGVPLIEFISPSRKLSEHDFSLPECYPYLNSLANLKTVAEIFQHQTLSDKLLNKTQGKKNSTFYGNPHLKMQKP